jgi:nucleotide-binding universal stress UspA family protein
VIREIYVPLLGARCDEGALDSAMALAVGQEAHVTAMVTLTHPMPMVSEMGMIVVETDQRQVDALREAATNIADRARARLGRQPVSGEVRLTECYALWSEEAAALQALHCDLSILGKPRADETWTTFSHMFRSLLLRSGRPVLVLPEGASLLPPIRRVVLAWKPTPEAARALHEAMPLLSRAAEVDVLVVDPVSTEGGYGEQPGADIAHLIARHGLKARVLERPREGASTGACILRHVLESEAELLVMGGYGHRHLRELVLGGATRDVLDRLTVPALFAH